MFPPNPMLKGAEPSAIKPADLLFRIPLWMDLSMHALPAMALMLGGSRMSQSRLMVDFLVLETPYTPPSSNIYAPLLAFAFGSAYPLWIEHCATINGQFPYPFLTAMTAPQRVQMYVGSSIGALLVFWGLNAVKKRLSRR